MNLDDEICYCFHVSMRKLVNYSKREKPSRPSLMTRCLSAGTGCGWCIPFLTKIAEDPDRFALEELSAEQYAAKRSDYRTSGTEKNTFGVPESDDV